MPSAILWLDKIFKLFPLPVLETWGKVAYLFGTILTVCAFSGITFRVGGAWAFGRERYQWDPKSYFSIPITFALVVVSGFLGSFVNLVPGAQTFESVKDLVVFLCILYFGYPALVTVPFAYALSDIIEGVPLEFLLDWGFGYFMNPAFYWLGLQILGSDPDFKKLRTWARYLFFVPIFMAFQPVLWGYICSNQFTPELSYLRVSTALVLTMAVTWVLVPPATLLTYPLVKRFQYFWAQIPFHVKQKRWAEDSWNWLTGDPNSPQTTIPESATSVPVRIFLSTPFVVLMLAMMAGLAAVTLRGAEADATALAIQLHKEYAENLALRIDKIFAEQGGRIGSIDSFSEKLSQQQFADGGRFFILDANGALITSLDPHPDPVATSAARYLRHKSGHALIGSFSFEYVNENPLSLEKWLGYQVPYTVPDKERTRWTLVTLVPEKYYLKGIRAGHSRAGTMLVLALLAAIGLAALLSGVVTSQLRDLSRTAARLSKGDLGQRASGGTYLKLQEIEVLARSINVMASQLESSFAELFTEVQQRRAVETELIEHRDNLEELVRSRTLELSRVLERAEAGSMAKSRFLALMGHELRTPLNAVLGYAQLLLRDQRFEGAPRVHLEAIRSSGEHLLRLLNDVLEMSHLESGHRVLAKEIFNPKVLVAETVAMVAPVALEAGLGLTQEFGAGVPLAVEQDAGKIRQIIVNLIDNAVKFTQFGTIKVRCTFESGTSEKIAGSGHLIIEVEDTGCGIAQADLELIFDSFFQLEDGIKVGGVGLGLSVCLNLARQMDGTIEAFSEIGVGSTFRLSLPVRVDHLEESENEGGANSRASKSLAVPRILVAHDSELSRVLFDSLLPGIGFDIRVYGELGADLRADTGWNPDIAIVSLHDPIERGLAVLERLREEEPSLPILVVDFTTGERAARVAGELGANVVVAGYGEPKELANQVSKLLTAIANEPGISESGKRRLLQAQTSADKGLAEAFSTLPEDLLSELRESSLAARPSVLMGLTGRVEEHCPKAADELRILVGRFAYNEILDLLPLNESGQSTVSQRDYQE